MFLSVDNMVELTGWKRVDMQRQWLREHGYKFDVRRNGSPVVLQAEVERMLFGEVTQIEIAQPNFSRIMA